MIESRHRDSSSVVRHGPEMEGRGSNPRTSDCRHGRPSMQHVESHGGGLEQVVSHSSTIESEDQVPVQQHGKRRRQVWLTAKTILGTFAVLFSLAMLATSIKMVAKYGDTGLVHVSFICVGFTVSSAPPSCHVGAGGRGGTAE